MAHLALLHWDAAEGAARAETLTTFGWSVDLVSVTNTAAVKRIAARVPEVIVIDLSRLPSQGRDAAAALLARKPLRTVPLLFLGGQPEKVEMVRQAFPQSTFADWRRVRSALREALRHPAPPVARPAAMAGYSGTPLPRKLGIKENARVLFINAPDGFEETLGGLPAGVEIIPEKGGAAGVVILFLLSRDDLIAGLGRAERRLEEAGKLWLAWPKLSSGVVTDLTQNFVREFALTHGLVDYKICAIDQTWSGLLFARRKPEKRA